MKKLTSDGAAAIVKANSAGHTTRRECTRCGEDSTEPVCAPCKKQVAKKRKEAIPRGPKPHSFKPAIIDDSPSDECDLCLKPEADSVHKVGEILKAPYAHALTLDPYREALTDIRKIIDLAVASPAGMAQRHANDLLALKGIVTELVDGMFLPEVPNA